MMQDTHANQESLIFQTGSNVKLIHKAELCKSIIADGKELITGNERGPLRVPELKSPKVYITFKENLTDLSMAFYGCTALLEISERLFANCPEVTAFTGTFLRCDGLAEIPENLFANNLEVKSFYMTFSNCYSLISIPENLFVHNQKATSFGSIFECCTSLTSIPSSLFDNNRKLEVVSGLFDGCTALTGESPYTMIDGQKVHLYERTNFPNNFTAPTLSRLTFTHCTGLTDYAQIPNSWE